MKQKMDQYLETLLLGRKIPGCGLRVRRHGQIVYDRCLGYGSLERQTPVTPNSIFRLASMTKLITAVGVMNLVETGRMSLDDSILHFFPHFPAEKRPVTVRHLLNHCSGLGQGEAGNQFFADTMNPMDSLAQRIDRLADMPFDCQPGQSSAYSPLVGFDIIGQIIALVSGQSPEEYLQEVVFRPLGMKDTSFYVPPQKLDRLVDVYNYVDGQLDKVPDDDPLILMVTSSEQANSCSAGLYGTLDDYDRFTTMLANDGELDGVRILKKETLELMRTPRQLMDIEYRPGCSWGLGFLIFEEPEKSNIHVAHNTFGWSGAFGTHMFVNKETGLSATFMINMNDLNGEHSFISREIEKIVFGMES